MPGIVQTPPTPALPHKGGGSFERAWPFILFPLRGRTVAYELYVVIPGARRARNPEGSGMRALRPGIHAGVRADGEVDSGQRGLPCRISVEIRGKPASGMTTKNCHPFICDKIGRAHV